MSNYRISLATPHFSRIMDPSKLPGLPEELPVDMDALLRVLAINVDLYEAATVNFMGIDYDATEMARLPAGPRSEAAFVDLVKQDGVLALKRFATIRVTPIIPTISEPMPAFVSTETGSLIHRHAVEAIRVKLGTLLVEVSEARAALESLIQQASPSDAPFYVPVAPTLGVDILALGKMSISVKSDETGGFHPYAVLPASTREILQSVTHALTPDNGLGHTHQDSTPEGLMREHEGSLAGDRHEQLLRKAVVPEGEAK